MRGHVLLVGSELLQQLFPVQQESGGIAPCTLPMSLHVRSLVQCPTVSIFLLQAEANQASHAGAGAYEFHHGNSFLIEFSRSVVHHQIVRQRMLRHLAGPHRRAALATNWQPTLAASRCWCASCPTIFVFGAANYLYARFSEGQRAHPILQVLQHAISSGARGFLDVACHKDISPQCCCCCFRGLTKKKDFACFGGLQLLTETNVGFACFDERKPLCTEHAYARLGWCLF